MIVNLEARRAELNLARVRIARQETEFNILERQADIERMTESVAKQKEAEEKLEKQLAELKAGGK